LRADARWAPDRGTGLVSSIAGVTVFLAFLFFAVQLLFNLYATSVVTSTAYDGARSVAASPVDHDDPVAVDQARQRAEAHMRDVLGEYGDRVHFDWTASDATTVALRIQVQNPRLTFGDLDGRLGYHEIDRTIRVRIEEAR
jgi:hypothetical protein